ncbi:hypothetical protein E8E14_005018 [Neopestalotiopsis sp. 37M]|nr:hypothetical protein E8E14_005018 [Neopestalotiopsis sp. 37M]
MPPKKQNNSDGVDAGGVPAASTFTEAEARMLSTILLRMTPGINALIDWDKVCEDLGSKSVQSTKERFRQISAKHGWFKQEPSAGMATPAGKKTAARTPGSKNKKSPVSENDDGPGDDTPVKKRKTAASKKVKDDEPNAAEDQATENHDGANVHADGVGMDMGISLTFDEV